MVEHSSIEKVSISNELFELTHVKIRGTGSRQHSVAFCAANRLVKSESIVGKLPGLFGRLRDNDGEFTYMCYVASAYLDQNVRSERTDFEIAQSGQELLGDLSFDGIRTSVLQQVNSHLQGCLEENRAVAKERVNSFISNRAPRYRPIMSHISIDDTPIDPSMSDKELELSLHKHYADLETKLISDGHDLLKPASSATKEEYSGRIDEYLRTAEDIKKSDLANYVFHRRVIIDLLKKSIERDEAGKYVREELIHKLIVPMRVDSSKVLPYDFNLWLIDERLAFHNYLSSDKPLSSTPICDTSETKEPDILALNVFDNPLLISDASGPNLASIVVAEIKRPMRDDAAIGEDRDPIEQALMYLDKVRKGGVKTVTGRIIPSSESIPGFCYILCDLTPSIIRRCESRDAIRTADGLGYFFYHRLYKAYVEVNSFDRLVNSAEQRHRAFFDHLGLPCN